MQTGLACLLLSEHTQHFICTQKYVAGCVANDVMTLHYCSSWCNVISKSWPHEVTVLRVITVSMTWGHVIWCHTTPALDVKLLCNIVTSCDTVMSHETRTRQVTRLQLCDAMSLCDLFLVSCDVTVMISKSRDIRVAWCHGVPWCHIMRYDNTRHPHLMSRCHMTSQCGIISRPHVTPTPKLDKPHDWRVARRHQVMWPVCRSSMLLFSWYPAPQHVLR